MKAEPGEPQDPQTEEMESFSEATTHSTPKQVKSKTNLNFTINRQTVDILNCLFRARKASPLKSMAHWVLTCPVICLPTAPLSVLQLETH